jgi:hypothetical protein
VAELPNHKGAWTVTPADITELGELADTAQVALNRLVSGSAVDVKLQHQSCHFYVS